jgi:hypothetical protein
MHYIRSMATYRQRRLCSSQYAWIHALDQHQHQQQLLLGRRHTLHAPCRTEGADAACTYWNFSRPHIQFPSLVLSVVMLPL